MKIPPARRLCPAARMLRAALTSLSCSVPQSAHIHSLIPSPALPFGLLTERLPQHEHVWVLYASLTSANTTDRAIALYFSCVFNMNQPASKTLLIRALGFAELHFNISVTLLAFQYRSHRYRWPWFLTQGQYQSRFGFDSWQPQPAPRH